MEIKFFLNKLVKIDNIEGYTLSTLKELSDLYDKFLEKSEGVDPDYPLLQMGGKKKKGENIVKTKNSNVYSMLGEGETKEDVYNKVRRRKRKKHGR